MDHSSLRKPKPNSVLSGGLGQSRGPPRVLNEGMLVARQRVLAPVDILDQSVPFIDLLFSTWTPDVDLESHHPGLGFNYFIPILDYEEHFEHPCHLQYLRMEKKQQYEQKTEKVLRPNAEELSKLNK